MNLHRISSGRLRRVPVWVLPVLLALPPMLCVAADAPMAPRWKRFEHQFQSEVAYPNPGRVSLRVVVRSPQGETQVVPGFWDGGKTWRVRVLPGVAGRWSFRTICSDTNNAGLHNRTNEFLCTAGEQGNRWLEHGPLRVAREGTFYEHADRVPLFLAVELAWNATRRDLPREFEMRVRDLARRNINALAWTIWPGRDERGEGAFDPSTEGLNLEFLQRLDTKVDVVTRAGLLNIIAPAWEMRAVSEEVSEQQVAMLWEQALARWHANPALWLLAVESSSGGANIGRWRRIAETVFGAGAPAPVIFLPGETQWLWEEFRAEKWITGLGLKSAHLTTDDELQWLFNGPLAVEHQRSPARPILDLLPMTESSSEAMANARHLLWWGLLLNPPAGVSWQSDPAGEANGVGAAALHAAAFMRELPFGKLRPAPKLLTTQPGLESPRKFVTVAATEQQNVIVAYVPASPSVQLAASAISARHQGTWFNPRTGKQVLAGGSTVGTNVTYRTPDDGDWVLLLRAER